MWPWGHLAFGYLVYSLLMRARGDVPRDFPTLALAFGTQFPDLVDKPLAWTVGVLPNGRSLTHAAFTAVALVAVVHVLARRRGYGSMSAAFGVGYFTHLLGDALGPFLSGSYYYLSFLWWPVAPAIDYGEKSFFEVFASLELTALSGIELGLGLLVFVLWVADGRPGLRPLLSVPRRAYRRLSAN